jgi:hypothetical protein
MHAQHAQRVWCPPGVSFGVYRSADETQRMSDPRERVFQGRGRARHCQSVPIRASDDQFDSADVAKSGAKTLGDGAGGKDRDKWPATKQTARTELEGFSPSKKPYLYVLSGKKGGASETAMARPADCGDTVVVCVCVDACVKEPIFGVGALGETPCEN